MTRSLLIVLFAFACKDHNAEPRRGPALTPVVANQLRSLAGDCEVRIAKGERGTKELRLCKGRQSLMNIHLDDKRHLIEIEIGLWAPMRDEARQLIEIAIKGLVSEQAIAAIGERMGNAKADPVVIDGVRINAFRTQERAENPRYTVDLAW